MNAVNRRLASMVLDNVVYLENLNAPSQLLAAIKLVLDGKAQAVVSWIDSDVATRAATVASEVAIIDYGVAPGFGYQADAKPVFECQDEEDEEDWLENGARYEANFAARMNPYESPAALVEKAISAALPGGVERLNVRGRSAPFGLVRHLQPDAQVFPHTDNSDLDRPDVPEFSRARTNLSVVVYLDPSVGGELSIWHKRLKTREEIDAFRLTSHAYALDVSSLPPPVVIRPESGMVVIFDAKHIHSVGTNRGKRPRVTQSGFFLVSDLNDRSLSYY